MPIVCQEVSTLFFSYGPNEVGVIILSILQMRKYYMTCPMAMLLRSSQVPCVFEAHVPSMVTHSRCFLGSERASIPLFCPKVTSVTTQVGHEIRKVSLWLRIPWRFPDSSLCVCWWDSFGTRIMDSESKIQDWGFVLSLSCMTLTKSCSLSGIPFSCSWIVNNMYCIG